MRHHPRVSSGLELQAGVGPESLDRLERASDVLRRGIDCDVASVGWWDRDRGVLQTLLNVGELAPTELPRPVDECYALADHFVVERLLTLREAYTISPGGSDRRFAGLAVSFGRDVRAAAPIVVRGEVWGEFWVARVTRDDGDPRAPIDLAQLRWMADALALFLPGPDRASGALRAVPGPYELRVAGRVSPRLCAEFAPLEAAYADGTTVLRGHVEDLPRLYGHLNRVRRLGLELIALNPAA